MRRIAVVAGLTLGVVATLAVPALRADVKTTEKTQLRVEGILGRLFGGAARDGITSTVAVVGDRHSSTSGNSGEIIDLAEEKVYRLDIRRKEYTVVTFAELRDEWKKAEAEAEDNAERMREAQAEIEASGQALEFSADVKETGQRKSIAGYDTREVVLTITGHQQGMTVEEGGGFVMTNTMWLAPRIAAIDEIGEFQMKYMKALLGEEDTAAAMRQMTALFALFASVKPMMEKMQEEGRKLDGTPLQSTMVMESVRSAEAMKAAEKESGGGGGGIGGFGGGLARRALGRGQPQARSVLLTTTQELLSVTPSATDADVAIPAGFKEKK